MKFCQRKIKLKLSWLSCWEWQRSSAKCHLWISCLFLCLVQHIFNWVWSQVKIYVSIQLAATVLLHPLKFPGIDYFLASACVNTTNPAQNEASSRAHRRRKWNSPALLALASFLAVDIERLVITVRNEVAKVMFLHLSVCPQGGLPQCMLG